MQVSDEVIGKVQDNFISFLVNHLITDNFIPALLLVECACIYWLMALEQHFMGKNVAYSQIDSNVYTSDECTIQTPCTIPTLCAIYPCHYSSGTEVYMYCSPVLPVYTPMYMVWITFIASGISQQ